MAAVGELLSDVVSEFSDISSLSGSELVNKCDKIRISLKRIIADHLADIEILGKELQKTKGKQSQTEIILNFFHHLVSKFPHHVFAPSPTQLHCLTDTEKELSRREYKEFIFSIWNSMLTLLAEPVLKDIHATVVKLLHALLDLVKTKNVAMFSMLLRESVKLQAELNDIHEGIISSTSTDVAIFLLKLQSFFVIQKREGSFIEIKNISSLSCLKNNYCHILKIFTPDVCQLCADQVSTVWCIVLFQLEHGHFHLKSSSLDIIQKLLKCSGMPPMRIYHYFMFCTVASLEMVIKAIVENDEVQKGEDGWEIMLQSLNGFMEELFCVHQILNTQNSKEKCIDQKHWHVKHAIEEQYMIAICQYLSTDLQEISFHEGFSEDYSRFVGSLLTILRYFCHSTGILLSGTAQTTSTAQIRIEDIRKLSCWVIESGFLASERILDLTIQVLADCLVLEMQYLATMEQYSRCRMAIDCEILKYLSKSHQNFSSTIASASICIISGGNVGSVVTCARCLSACLRIMISATRLLVEYDLLPQYSETRIAAFFDPFLDVAETKKLLHSLLKIIINLADSEDFLFFMDICIKIVQDYNIFLHIASMSDVENLKKNIGLFCEQNSLLFTILSSLPWIGLSKLEDFGTDLKEFDMKEIALLPVTKGFEKNGLKLTDGENMAKELKNTIYECFKAIATLHSPKYARFRSMILFKWATNTSLDIRNVALTFLPFFIAKSLPGTGAFKGILTHVRSLLKDCDKDFSHSDLLPFCTLIHGVTMLMKAPCDIVLLKLAKETCARCAHFQPRIANFSLCLKKKYQYDEANIKKPKEDVLSLLGTIVSEINKQLSKNWIHVEGYQKHLRSKIDSDIKDCSFMLQSSAILLTAEYLCEIKDHPILENVRSLMKTWLKSLQFYLEADFGGVVLKGINLKEGSLWRMEITTLLEEILRTAIEEKNLVLRLALNRIFGIFLKSSITGNDCLIGGSEIFNWSLMQLFVALSSPTALVQSSAYLELCVLQSEDALQKFKSNISISLAKIIVGDHPLVGKRPLVEIIEDTAQIYSLNASEFLHQNLHTILPILVTSKRCEECLKLLNDITGVSEADLLMPNFKHIFCHAVISGYNLDVLFQYLEKQTRIKKDSLLLLNFGGLLHQLVSYMSVNMNQVHKAIDIISKVKDSSLRLIKKAAGLSNLSDLLRPHFLGILTFFNCQLRSASVTAIEKKNIIESLTCLLKLMKIKDVTVVRVKIINTLCLAQQLFKRSMWYEVCCDAWSAFVRRVEAGCLGSLLSQIAVTLLPLLETLPSQVADIMKYMVVERASDVKENLAELYFLPDHHLLRDVNLKVQSVIKSRKEDSLATHLSQAMQLMTHESSEVRVQALTRLRHTLKERQVDIQLHHSTTGQDSSDEVMSKLVSTLLSGCRDSNKKVKLLCGQCLGLIGAIDPDRLVLRLSGTVSTSEFFTVDNPNFAYHLISELVKSFLAAKPTHQDISAFAIQELLKIYECREGPRDTHGRRLWRRFSENMQEVLNPHHTSRYLLKKSEAPLSNLKQPVLFRKSNMTFREWAGIFCSLLMQMVYQANESTTASKVFRACSALVRNDVNVALFLLSHTTLQALLTTDHMDFIVQEVLAILEQTEELKDRVHVEFESETLHSRPNSAIDQPVSQDNSNLLNSQHARGSYLLQLSAQAIFSAMDHITRWLRQAEIDATDSKSRSSSSAKGGQMASNIQKIKIFLGKIPQLLLAKASFRCRAYRRALLHYEAHLRGNNSSAMQNARYEVDEQAITFLQQLFVEMDEPDGVAGIAAVRLGKPTLNIQIKQLESTGKLQDACACYSHAIQQNPNDMHRIKDYVKCLMDLGQLSSATCVMEGAISKQNSWKDDLNSYQIEAAWRLGQWDSLEEILQTTPDTSTDLNSRSHDWNTKLGELLLVVKANKWDQFQDLIDDVYLDQTGPLSAATMEGGSYQRGYKSILRLHMLTELEIFADLLKSSSVMPNISVITSQCFGLWQERLQPLQNSFKPREPILCLQRTMLDLLSSIGSKKEQFASADGALVKNLVGKLWLASAKQARRAGYLQTAYNALINAQEIDLPEFCIEQAKWLWNKGESHQALLTLQKGVSTHFPDNDTSGSAVPRNERISKAKAMLLVARLMEESSSFDSNTVLKQFREVVTFMPEWEDSHFHAAKYYDKLMTAFMGDSRSSGKASHLYYIMHHYGLSLCYGTSHIYESLTKLLTVWLDYEANVAKLEKAKKPFSKDDAQKLIDVISDLRDRLPAYIFLTAFSQLASRICHPHLATFEELKQVVAKVICAYPQQALWTLMAISKSSYSQRAQRCKEIFSLAELKDRKLSKIISDATRLTDKLLELCNKPASTTQSLSISTHFKPLKRLVEEDTFSEILLPLQSFMTVTLPQGDSFGPTHNQSTSSIGSSMKEHDPFPDKAIYIVGFEDLIEVLPSLQRPKKISIKASDGKSYLFLCKPKDDLRKDARLMEFNTIVNKCLKLDSETRKRQLKIRTYAVVPLNEECGLIEWVPNTQGFRNILLKIYRAKDLYTSGKILKSLQLPYTAPLEKKLEVFRNKLLPRHPAVFGDWFLATFPDPTSWYNARLAYARSTAVMSIVGYILGLGDRHGENILFDSITGEAVHVDFNCLFNKGLSLDVPEIVPFRLTHNMTDAMGPMRHEGFFQCACEKVMHLLRQQREPLLSVLKTFIYDPLVEWSKRNRGGQTNESGEILNEKALSHVSDIDKRLRGIAAKNKGLPLSVEGHVHYLIQEATDEEKLCQMYIGWAPYM